MLKMEHGPGIRVGADGVVQISFGWVVPVKIKLSETPREE